MSFLFLQNELATKSLSIKMAQCFKSLKLPFYCYLQGDLGAGKTTIVRFFLRALGYTKPVCSPTFSIFELYEFEDFSVIHLDLYRLSDIQELDFIGIEDYLNQKVMVFVEWPDKGLNEYLPPDLIIDMKEKDKGRIVEIKAQSAKGNQYAKCILAE